MSKSHNYPVSTSGYHRRLMLHWAQQAAQHGNLDGYLEELKLIDKQLTKNPLHWGDPQFDLNYSNIQVFRGLSKSLAVYYGVDFDRHKVIVKDIVPRTGTGYSTLRE
ncbi:MAG: hypothetical protein QM703_01060 [Gemmatales bacterium]